MTNKEYKQARENAENADALYEYEKYGYGFYPSRYMNADELKELRRTNKAINNAETLDGFNGRAVLIPVNGGILLKSYNTIVCGVFGGEFVKLWDGFSVTTLKHINLLRANGGMPAFSKREWIETPTSDFYKDGGIVNAETGEYFAV